MIFIKNKLLIITFISFLLLSVYVFSYKISYGFVYEKEVNEKNNKYVYGPDAPRGYIYDINGNLLVGNKEINNLYFRYEGGIDYVDIAKKISNIFDFGIASDKEILFYYKNTNNANKLLTDEEIELLNKRKLNSSEKESLINERILNMDYSENELRIAKIFYLIKNGTVYENKLLKKNIDNEEVNKVIKSNIKGLFIQKAYTREYLYEDVLKKVFGTVGKISTEDKLYYLNSGYNLNDEVGTSYLEKEYDNYLKGKKAVYKVNMDNSLTLTSEEEKGNDLYLNIDINLQMKVEEIIQNALLYAKKFPGTSALNDAYVIVGDANTSAIRAFAGQRINKNKFIDVSINNINSAFVMGSTVKGVGISVGLENNIIDPNQKIVDSCVKLHFVPEKCSHERLGKIDAIKALETSSNYYQFLIAIGLTGKTYSYNMDLKATSDHFDIYRSMFNRYGLGIKTGIDLPNEKIGIIGKKTADDLLLNLSIGQYDAYTPIGLYTYINTISQNGLRKKPSLLNYVKDDNNNIIYQNNYEVVGDVGLDIENYNIIKKGFYNVINKGTGRGFFNYNLNAAGKTGTSETFYDSNNDGIYDKSTINVTMAGFWPYDNPKYSIIVIVPNVSVEDNKIIHLNAKISREIADYIGT